MVWRPSSIIYKFETEKNYNKQGKFLAHAKLYWVARINGKRLFNSLFQILKNFSKIN